MGDAAVGKTTLVHRYIEGKFEDTISVSHGLDVLENKRGDNLRKHLFYCIPFT